MNGTKFIDIIELVLSILKSYKIDVIYDENKENGLLVFFTPYLKYAQGELEIVNSDISTEYDTESASFKSDLTAGQQLIIAKYIVIGYLSRETHDILQMTLHLQDGDFKTYAEKNNLEGKMNALYTLKEEVNWNVTKVGYGNTNVWGM
jgi:hypothetical protein